MPTRITLNQTASVPKVALQSKVPRGKPGLIPSAATTTTTAAATGSAAAALPSSQPQRNLLLLHSEKRNEAQHQQQLMRSTSRANKRQRQLPSFRSSILRELNVRGASDAAHERILTAVATDDIRASPRLLGYLFSMIAGAVMLVSVVQYVLCVSVDSFLS